MSEYEMYLKQEMKQIKSELKALKANNEFYQNDDQIELRMGRLMEIKEHLEYSYE